MAIKTTKLPIACITVFIWLGFVCSISFMEAWLKFRAANVTLAIGLSIGRLVFSALNKVEWAFAIIVMAYLAISKTKINFSRLIFFIIPVAILVLQTFCMLPALNERVEIILLGHEPAPSLLHVYYVVMEVVKAICLFVFGVKALQFYETEAGQALEQIA